MRGKSFQIKMRQPMFTKPMNRFKKKMKKKNTKNQQKKKEKKKD